MLIGGLAVIARGVRRATTDIDVVVKGDEAMVRDVIATLREHGVEPRIANAEAFARENLVLLARHGKTGVDVDLSFAWSSFEHEALVSREIGTLGRVRLPIARAEDLVVFKIVAGRAKDISDVEALLLMHPEVDRRVVRRRVAELADLAEEPEMLLRLEAILKA